MTRTLNGLLSFVGRVWGGGEEGWDFPKKGVQYSASVVALAIAACCLHLPEFRAQLLFSGCHGDSSLKQPSVLDELVDVS
jgi:hypothetical protein